MLWSQSTKLAPRRPSPLLFGSFQLFIKSNTFKGLQKQSSASVWTLSIAYAKWLRRLATSGVSCSHCDWLIVFCWTFVLYQSNRAFVKLTSMSSPCPSINDYDFSISFALFIFISIILLALFCRFVEAVKWFFHLCAQSVFLSFGWQSHLATYEKSRAQFLTTIKALTAEFLELRQLI